MIVNAGYRGKIGAAVPKFTYTGQYNVRKDGVVELLTSGTIVFLEPKVIDLFMVGGGGKGGRCVMTSSPAYYTANGGGGGGYTRTIKRLAAQGSYEITIGAGSTTANVDGGSTAWGTAYTVSGGKSSAQMPSAPAAASPGSPGGSGGGGGVISNSDYGTGGSDGNNGEQGYFGSVKGGTGQGFTTREFGEATGKLYAGAGGGGRYMVSQTPIVSMGGAGGGGTGGWAGNASGQLQYPSAGGANTGGGGGGAAANYTGGMEGGSGGSGIVCFRDAQELPELAGTWKFNERIYPPEIPFDIAANYVIANTPPSSGSGYKRIYISNNQLMGEAVIGQTNSFYNFATNTPVASRFGYFRTDNVQGFTDEFRAWLASNATKQ